MSLRAVLVLWFLGMAALTAQAQAVHDAQLWQGLILNKSFLKEQLRLSINEEVRIGQNFSTVKQAFTDISVGGSPFKFLDVSLGYRYAVREETNRHRIYTDFTLEPKMEGRFSVNLRLRTQLDMTNVDQDLTIRPRFNFTYNLPDTKIEPQIGIEPFITVNSLNPLDNVRGVAGLQFPLKKSVRLRLCYLIDHELGTPTPDVAHATVARIVVDLDKDSDKKKRKKDSI